MNPDGYKMKTTINLDNQHITRWNVKANPRPRKYKDGVAIPKVHFSPEDLGKTTIIYDHSYICGVCGWIHLSNKPLNLKEKG